MKRIGYVNIDQKNINFHNFIQAFQVLLSRIKVIKEEVNGRYIQYLAESNHFELVDEDKEIPHYDVRFVVIPRIEVFFLKRELFMPLATRVSSTFMTNDMISVQPLKSPSSSSFYLDYKIKNNGISNRALTQPSCDTTRRNARKNVRKHFNP